MKLSQFDKIVCLCLDRRLNQWEELEKAFLDRGAKPERFVVGKGKVLPKDQYSLIDPMGQPIHHEWDIHSFGLNAYYCYMAHREILKKAQKEGVRNLLLLEDDCKLLENFDEVIDNVEKEVEENNISWDMLYYGSNHSGGKTKKVSNHLLKLLGGTYCFHCVAINQSHNNMLSHLLSMPLQGPFDWLTSRITQPQYNCYAIWPSIAIQKPGMSYVMGSIQDYTEYFNNQGNQE
jgi:GR25 family glycosyltransferase involved in LPS biosynthesis